MRVFLTGASGFVGSAVAEDLLAAGHEVRGLARSKEAARRMNGAGVQPALGSLRDLAELEREARQADAVIHTAFDHDFANMARSCDEDRAAIAAMGRALEGSDKPLIVTAGLPQTPGRLAREIDDTLAGGQGGPRQSEQAAMSLFERGVTAMVVRMPQVHDQTKQGFATFLLEQAKETRLSAFVGRGDNRWAAVHRLDAARIYRLVLEKGQAGRRYHAVGENGITFRDIAIKIADRLSIPVVAMAPEESEKHFGWLHRIVTMDIPADSARTRLELGWHPIEPDRFLTNLAGQFVSRPPKP